MPGFDLVILDLDLTLWDHPDASSLTPPFRRTGRDSAADSEGVEVGLRPGARSFLDRCVREGVRLAVASWNDPDPVSALMKALELDHFSHVVVEGSPDKVPMVRRILSESGVPAERALFVDDREENVRAVAGAFPGIRVLAFGREAADFRELEGIVFGWAGGGGEAGR